MAFGKVVCWDDILVGGMVLNTDSSKGEKTAVVKAFS